MIPHHNIEGKQELGDQQNFQEDYYSNFARRVYMIAEQENWDRATTMKYFNDRQSFEKFFANVSRHIYIHQIRCTNTNQFFTFDKIGWITSIYKNNERALGG